MPRFTDRGWAIVPGPPGPDDGTITSIDRIDLAEIDPEVITRCVAALPGAVVKPAVSWWDWKATMERSSDWLTLQMTLAGDEEQWWGGFGVEECSSPELLADVAAELAAAVPGVWLHSDDCQMWSPARFRHHWCEESP